jgi:putative transposase
MLTAARTPDPRFNVRSKLAFSLDLLSLSRESKPLPLLLLEPGFAGARSDGDHVLRAVPHHEHSSGLFSRVLLHSQITPPWVTLGFFLQTYLREVQQSALTQAVLITLALAGLLDDVLGEYVPHRLSFAVGPEPDAALQQPLPSVIERSDQHANVVRVEDPPCVQLDGGEHGRSRASLGYRAQVPKSIVTKQAKALNISRGSVYYLPRPVPEADLAIMQRLDRLHLEFPFAGSRMLRGLLAAEGCKIGRRHVKTLMKRMGIEALYRRPRTTKPEPGHKIYPYLLRGMEIVRPNQVWAMDITYIPMARGFVYLAVVLDWFSRRVLSWGVSITMEAAFCVETLEDALARHGKPDIFNTDQGSQFTGSAFTGVLASNGIAISMDGKGAWRDNVFVERLWRSVKYEEVYLRAYESVSEARTSIGRYLDFYNGRRPHSSLDGTTPDQAYFTPLPLRLAA